VAIVLQYVVWDKLGANMLLSGKRSTGLDMSGATSDK
jgi:hypothetical protein